MPEFYQDDGVGGLTGKIIRAAIDVHRALGPGLLEKTYEACLQEQLRHRGIRAARQVWLPLEFLDLKIPKAYRVDLLVEKKVVVELKVATRLTSIDVSQVLTYLRLADLRVGLLFNFNLEALAAGGIKRVLRTT